MSVTAESLVPCLHPVSPCSLSPRQTRKDYWNSYCEGAIKGQQQGTLFSDWVFMAVGNRKLSPSYLSLTLTPTWRKLVKATNRPLWSVFDHVLDYGVPLGDETVVTVVGWQSDWDWYQKGTWGSAEILPSTFLSATSARTWYSFDRLPVLNPKVGKTVQGLMSCLRHEDKEGNEKKFEISSYFLIL